MDFLFTYVLNYSHITTPSLDRLINLNKLKTLKHGNNAKILKNCKFKTANLKSFWMGDLHFLYTLKWLYEFQNCFFFLSPTHNTHKFRCQLRDTFFHCLSPLSEFSFQSNPHRGDPFLILRNTRFHNRYYIWIVTSFKSTTR